MSAIIRIPGAWFLVLKTDRRLGSVRKAQTLASSEPILGQMALVREFAFHEEFDISQKLAIGQRFESMRENGLHTTILDLSDVSYLDTTFLNAMVALQKWTVNDNTDSHLCIVAGRNLSRILHITALDKMFPVFATMALAREYAVLQR